MKIRKRNLLLIGYLSLITLTVASISVSAAWFVAAANVHVESVKVQARTERSLQISTSDELSTFKDSISYSELKDSGLFQPVTSMYSDVNFINDKGSAPVFLSSYNVLTPTTGVPYTPDVASKGYFSETFYLYADDDLYVTLDPSATKFEADHENNLALAKQKTGSDEEAEKMASQMDHLINALRISILDPDEDSYSYTILDPYKDSSTVETTYGGRLDLTKSGFYNYYVAANGEKYETIYGEVNDRDKAVYDEVSEENTSYTGTLSSFNSGTKAGVHAYNEETSLANGLSYVKEDSCSLEEFRKDSNKWIPIKRYTPKKIVVSIYLEGWDRDCVNETMGASFLSTLSFMIARER